MNFDISFTFKTEESEVIRFLNSNAKDFYLYKHHFKDKNFCSIFKGSLQTAMVDIERTIRGTFGCEMHLENIDTNLLKKMFPNATKNIFNIDVDLLFMGKFLETLRNIN